MNPIRRKAMLVAIVAGGFVAVAAAQSGGGPYLIDPAAIAGGGGTSSGGAYRLSGTFGQPATARLSGSAYVLHDGFWAPSPGSSPIDPVFADGFDPGP
ncbi:MAG TPA: hypothetical protein VFG55_06825 [Rhodanobacteraceae bacterium]|nr:hypothetical protein [Rhodanobacteraceae bacterium]